ncbi:MAG: DUF4433 domain-containing protein [Ignavibacteria bacterium]|jgi:hypothetical protein
MPVPQPTKIYRIVHIENLRTLVKAGEIPAQNYSSLENYIPIGETELIKNRSELYIPVEPFGSIKDYVAFYFGLRSPMLYCIKNGFDVRRRRMSEIIYLITTIEELEKLNKKYIFTDGHAYAAFTAFFNKREDLNKVDWSAVNLIRWNNTASDPDRKRRKQAECFVHKSVNIGALKSIAVYDKESYNYVNNILKEFKINIRTIIKPEWYY